MRIFSASVQKLLRKIQIIISIALAGTLMSCANFARHNSAIEGPFIVTGTGKTEEEARHDAFKQAIEYAVGIAVRSELVVKDSEVARSNLLIHSAGYVEKFKILESEQSENNLRLKIEVYIKPTIVDDYVLYSSKSIENINGSDVAAKIESRLKEFKSGDAFLESILNDYPHRALEVKQVPFQFIIDDRRRKIVRIDLAYRFNPKYLSSLSQVFARVKNGNADRYNAPSITLTYNKLIYFHNGLFGDRHLFTDINRFSIVKKKLLQPYSFKAFFKTSDGEVIYQTCLETRYELSDKGRDYLGRKAWDINCNACEIDDLWIDSRWDINLDDGHAQKSSLTKNLDRLSKIEVEPMLYDQCRR
jgi:hypothetical protein